MALNSLAALVLAAAAELLPPGGSAIDLGNQRFRPQRHILDRIRRDATCRIVPALWEELLRSADGKAPELTRQFYSALGFSRYEAIDVNDQFGSLMMDLNFPLRERYGFTQSYDLVVNNGTGEHVFNQLAVFENMHALCRPGGLMVHIVPFVNYLNHGFFNFNPLLYCDLAQANGYAVEAIGIGTAAGEARILTGDARSALFQRAEIPFDVVRRSIHGFGDRPAKGPRSLARRIVQKLRGDPLPPWHQLERVISGLLAAARRDNGALFPNLLVIAVLRRTSDEPFVIPFQGKYVGAIKADEIRGSYTSQQRDKLHA